jgi:hypothetical protein
VSHRWALGKEFFFENSLPKKIIYPMPLCVALGKEIFFENSLPSTPLRGTRAKNFF